MEEIKYFRKMKNIDRMMGHPKLRNYSIMEHQYMVAVLFKHFASKEDISYGMFEFDLILKHDILEVVTGDLVYPVKNYSEKTKRAWGIIEDEVLRPHFKLNKYSDKWFKESLSELQHRLFKACDYLDLWIFCKEEQELGNNNKEIHEIIFNCENLIKGKFKSIDKFMENYVS